MKQEVSQGTRVGAGSVAPPPPPPPKRAAITEVFGGVMCSVVTCGSCGGRSFSTEPTVCLSLEIPLKKAPLSERAQAYLAKSRARAAGTPAATAAAAAATAENDVTTATATAAGSPTASGAHDESASKASSAAGGRPDPKALPAAPQDLLPGFQLPVSCKQRRKVRTWVVVAAARDARGGGVGRSMRCFCGKRAIGSGPFLSARRARG